jgi:hypothetical protein
MATKGSTDVMATSLAHRVGSLERVGRTAFTAPGAKNPPRLRGVFLLQAAELALRARTVLACARNTPHIPGSRHGTPSAQNRILVGSFLPVRRHKRFLDAHVVFLERRGLSERSEFRSPGRNTTYASSAQT